MSFTTEMVADLPKTLKSPQASSASGEDSGEKGIWAARAVIVGVAAALAWYTWGHWGDFQIDNGRELYVPAEILKGKLLFRDLWYMYGPLAPYVKAFLFRIFGVQLTVLYVFGLALTIGTALVTFEIARRFRMGLVGSTVPSLFFLFEAFYPSIRNFVYPYSYAASLAAFLGLACLYFVLRHASGMRALDLGLAAVLGSLVILTKQEFGVACLALLGFEIAACYWNRRSSSDLIRDIAACFAGLLPAVAGYGWFVWKLSARLIFFENWISTPGTYFMRTFGKITIPAQGLRFVPSELLICTEYTLLAVAEWALLATIAVYAIKKLDLRTRSSMAVAVTAALTPLWIGAIAFLVIYPMGIAKAAKEWTSLIIPTTESIFPHGLFFLVVFFTGYALWKLARAPRDEMALQEAALGIYAALVALRVMMLLRATLFQCTVFFNGAAFIVFTILLYRIVRWACRTLDAKRADFVIGSMFAGETALLFLLLFPRPEILTTRLTTDQGSFYTKPDVAVLFPQIISFMKTHTRNGKDILVLPEPPSLYVFAGMEAPSRMYALVPGYVAPEQEQQYIDEVASNHVRYVLISNRIVVEYHVTGFGNGGYNVPIYQWIMANYVKVGQFGPLPDADYPPYTMWIYARKDLAQEN
ncbi:MAG TPA: hypothetical protein VN976_11980 [Verrucomicrobiae bacterium]|nr:hypothetical protein [Verrucomicrobiae bacterium]